MTSKAACRCGAIFIMVASGSGAVLRTPFFSVPHVSAQAAQQEEGTVCDAGRPTDKAQDHGEGTPTE
ncbi:Protein of unknown function [Pyronema omphalodes CBS 100304]|uniref:Secreted protein n=1 Tax=Pyronema omphalodes (strain CBS 100304) TaxID=1076935 RepID=U4L6E9_PYROM|nr:Protein of unknown function [Pyronema omphalodes CBS 100304]